MSDASARNLYDAVPYPSRAIPRCHPDRLAAIARLFGLEPAPADRCRVLEVGCATAANLLPMAERHPESTYVGVDSSQVQIDTGRRAARALELDNLELLHADLDTLDDALGTFDYVIAHGVLSWVPRQVQQTLLAVCRRSLNEQGVAYVSYNVLPGFYVNDTLRALLLRLASEGGARDRLKRGREVLTFLSHALARQPAPYAALVRGEVDAALAQPDGYLFHEYFEPDNHALYFHEFAELAARHELQFLAEAHVPAMFPANFGTEVEKRLADLTTDPLAAQQYLDVLLHRGFRQTLLCHQRLAVSRQPTPEGLRGLRFAAPLQPENALPDLATAAPEGFTTPRGLGIGSRRPAIKAALFALGSAWPGSLSFDELNAAAGRLSTGTDPPLAAADRAEIEQHLSEWIVRGLVDFFSAADAFVAAPGPRPRVGPVARAEARSSHSITNRRHTPVALDDVTRLVVLLADGSRDCRGLAAELTAALVRGEVPGFDPGAGLPTEAEIVGAVDHCLLELAHNALLVS